MNKQHFPKFDVLQNSDLSYNETRDALHIYARILGDWLKHNRLQRKHWWHASLRPSLNGLTTGVVHAEVDFEIELNLRESLLQIKTSPGDYFFEKLHGQSAAELADYIKRSLLSIGVSEQSFPKSNDNNTNQTKYPDYSAEHARTIFTILISVSSAMKVFRAGIREETSPVQLWPHHFDLSMLWLPGELIPDQDPSNEEHADKQMNFGFTLGDENIPEPYFYITAYPLPEALPATQLPAGAAWYTETFSGAIVTYKTLTEINGDAHTYLQELWSGLLQTGRKHMLENATVGA
jgi:hypothetical protein